MPPRAEPHDVTDLSFASEGLEAGVVRQLVGARPRSAFVELADRALAG